MIEMFEQAEQKIYSELNISRIVKSLRNMKILMKNSLMGNEV